MAEQRYLAVLWVIADGETVKETSAALLPPGMTILSPSVLGAIGNASPGGSPWVGGHVRRGSFWADLVGGGGRVVR